MIAVRRKGRHHVLMGMCCNGQVLTVIPIEGGVPTVTTGVIHLPPRCPRVNHPPPLSLSLSLSPPPPNQRVSRPPPPLLSLSLSPPPPSLRVNHPPPPLRHLSPSHISQPSRLLAPRLLSFGQAVSSSSCWGGSAHLGHCRLSQRQQ